MRRLLWVLLAALVGTIWVRSGPGALDLAGLQARAALVRREGNVSQRSQVDAFYALADAYAQAGRAPERHAELAYALSLDPGNAPRQLEAAELEIAAGSHDDAHDRIAGVLEGGPDGALRARADQLAERLRALGFTPRPVAPPQVVDRLVLFRVFAGTDRTLVTEIASRVGVAFGVKVAVLDGELAPASSRARSGPTGIQLDADELIAQLGVSSGPVSPDLLATVGVCQNDLYADQLNFVFGTAGARLGVFSIARFALPGDSRDALLSRATKQAFSTTGFTLGVPRCNSASCARAYPHSLSEMDRKGHSLCRECRKRVDRALGRER